MSCRLTAPFSGRPLTLQHAGAQDLFEHNVSSPAAKHFIDPGPLQRFVRRHVDPRALFMALSRSTETMLQLHRHGKAVSANELSLTLTRPGQSMWHTQAMQNLQVGRHGAGLTA